MGAIEKTKGMRQTNLELLRIIAMLLVIASHYVSNSGLLAAKGPIATEPLATRSLFLLVFDAFGKTGINCFVLISGFFMCQKSITLRKYLKLVFELMFYKIVIALFFWLTGYARITLRGILDTILPVRSLGSGFTSAYIIFFLLIPFLNILIQHMSEKQHIRLLALVSFIYIFLGTFRPLFSVTMNYVSWFSVLHLIAAYIRLYPKKIFDNKKFWGVAALSCFILSSISVLVCTWLSVKFTQSISYTFLFMKDSNALMAVLTGISAFLFFKNLSIPQSKLINTVAATTFGILCIHANSDTMRRWLWRDTLHNVAFYHSRFFYIHAFGSVVAVFAVCSLIDYLRIRLIEKPFFNVVDKKLPVFVDRFQRIERRFFEKCGIQPK